MHEGGYRLELDEKGELVVHRSDGLPLPQAPPDVELSGDPEHLLADENRARGIDITSETMPAWQGESMDYDWAVSSLMR